ncbi:hypothetical protein [Paraburkholderia sp. LEh10]|uniref:hypothetical protein n=1 Tax=Paraburkholderia sp. LEh10 TaxID=2821353 RepID=UPI001FD7ED73|nr:hypothetical protein [Paraburkholderia sp. LEh10]
MSTVSAGPIRFRRPGDFPVVVPFIFISKVVLALRVSNLLAIVTQFIGGYALGRYTGGRPWLSGAAMSGIGVALLAIIMARRLDSGLPVVPAQAQARSGVSARTTPVCSSPFHGPARCAK